MGYYLGRGRRQTTKRLDTLSLAGTYHDCIATKDTTSPEQNVREQEVYGPGVEMARELPSPPTGS